jgi:hypothetical protein
LAEQNPNRIVDLLYQFSNVGLCLVIIVGINNVCVLSGEPRVRIRTYPEDRYVIRLSELECVVARDFGKQITALIKAKVVERRCLSRIVDLDRI